MNRKVAVSAIMAMSLTTAGLAFAQGYGSRDSMGRDNAEREQRGSQMDRRDSADRAQRDRQMDHRDNSDRAQRDRQMDRRDNEARQPNRRGNQRRAYNNEQRDERGAGPDHAFRRGDRLPAEYRHRNYVVDDWRGHNLSAPPRGYQWVQTGGDYLLVAVATGIIAQLLLNN